MRGFSQTITFLRESPTRKIDAIRERLKRENRDVINLSAGQPGIPPPIEIRSMLANQLIENKGTDLYGYTVSPQSVVFHRLLLDGLPGPAHRSGSPPVAGGSSPYGSWEPRVTGEGVGVGFINLTGDISL